MESELQEGRLIKWNDDRGFGFIQPIDGGKEVFLHISAVKKSIRRPQVGDMIWYGRVTEAKGKIRAIEASIQGVERLPAPTQKQPRQSQNYKTTSKTKSTAPQGQRRRGKWNSWINPLRAFNPVIVMGFLIAVGVLGSVMRGDFILPFFTKKYSAPIVTAESPSAPVASTVELGCTVKGNISVSSGRKLYHVPGMEDYEITTIDEFKGERWFCTEADAIANGWARAPK